MRLGISEKICQNRPCPCAMIDSSRGICPGIPLDIPLRPWQDPAMRKKYKTRGRKAKKQTSSAGPTAAAAPLAPTVAETVPAATSQGRQTSKKRASTKRSLRYSPEQQAEIVQFVQDYNAKNGRAGQASAS